MNADLLSGHLPHIGKLRALLRNTDQICCAAAPEFLRMPPARA